MTRPSKRPDRRKAAKAKRARRVDPNDSFHVERVVHETFGGPAITLDTHIAAERAAHRTSEPFNPLDHEQTK